MSKIVSPYPPMLVTDNYQPPENASWWRFQLRPNHDEFLYEVMLDEDGKWISWEFFDGEQSIIDCGFDRPVLARLHEFWCGGLLDVLYVGPPTPSPYWQPLTEPGDHTHPDDRPSRPIWNRGLLDRFDSHKS